MLKSAYFLFDVLSQPPGIPWPFECSVDAAMFTDCMSPILVPGPLSDGSHKFRVRVAGGPITTNIWLIDSILPELYFSITPNHAIAPASIYSFSVASSKPAIFLCSLDDSILSPCNSTTAANYHTLDHFSYANLSSSRHKLVVTAVDVSGNRASTLMWFVTSSHLSAKRSHRRVTSQDSRQASCLSSATSRVNAAFEPCTPT